MSHDTHGHPEPRDDATDPKTPRSAAESQQATGSGGDAGPSIKALLEVAPSLQSDPSIGVSLVDARGTIVFCNRRAASMFLGRTPDEVSGRKLTELFDSRWADERLGYLRTSLEQDRPVVVRSIRRGVRIQSTLHPLHEPGDRGRVLVTSVEGQSPEDQEPRDALVYESELVDLGPLDVLSPRELEVLAMIGQGLSQVEIAGIMHRSVRTVEKHRQAISSKLREASRIKLGQIAARAGLTLADLDRPRTHDP